MSEENKAIRLDEKKVDELFSYFKNQISNVKLLLNDNYSKEDLQLAINANFTRFDKDQKAAINEVLKGFKVNKASDSFSALMLIHELV